MIAVMQSLSAFAGLISMVLLLVLAVVAGRYMARANINTAASEAQKSAINAMHEEIGILRNKIDDVKKENIRLQFIMETISAALKNMGIIVSIDGDMVRIKDGKDNSNITTRIHGTGWVKEGDQ